MTTLLTAVCDLCYRAVISAALTRCVDAQQYETHAGRMRALKASAVIKNSMRKRNQLKYNTPSRTLKFNPNACAMAQLDIN